MVFGENYCASFGGKHVEWGRHLSYTLAWDLGASGMDSDLIFNDSQSKKNNFLVQDYLIAHVLSDSIVYEEVSKDINYIFVSQFQK